MLYNDISVLLGTVASDAERIRILSSPTQNQDNGIVDNDTDVNKSYFERDYGLYDAITALYNVFNGRNTIATGEYFNIGTAQFGHGFVELSAGLTVNGGLSQMGAALFNNTTSLNGAVTVNADMTFGNADLELRNNIGLSFINNDDLGSTNVGYGSAWDFMKTINQDALFTHPEDYDYYKTTLGTGGAFKFATADRSSAIIAAKGLLVLGDNGSVYDDPDSAAGVTICIDDTSGSTGWTALQLINTALDDRTNTKLYMRNRLLHTTNATVLQEFYMDTNGGVGTSYWKWDIDNVNVALMDDAGSLSIGGDLGAVNVDASGTLDVTGVGTFLDDVDITGDITGVDNITSTGEISATGTIFTELQIRAGTLDTHCLLGRVSNDVYFQLRSGGVFTYMGLIDTLDNSAMLLASGRDRYRMMYGPSGTASGPLRLELDETSNTNRSSLVFGITGGTDAKHFFVDENGSPCVSDSATGLGADDTGAFVSKGNVAASVDVTSQASLNAVCQTLSESVALATVIVRDSVSGDPKQVIFNGANWEVVT